jgi:hypothetical protein
MSPAIFVKRYSDPVRCAAAREHLEWLVQLGSGARLPRLYGGTATRLVLEHLDGQDAGTSDLATIATVLGRLHGIAYTRELDAARLDEPFRTTTGLTIADFHSGRRHAIAAVGADTADLPVAVYKDTNIRNIIITATGPAIVDFDDLTLAPFGYDLAKLVVSAAMTNGHIPARRIETAVSRYNSQVEAAGGPPAPCSMTQFAVYTEMHHLLTARYLNRNGYQHCWPAVRPWPNPIDR